MFNSKLQQITRGYNIYIYNVYTIYLINPTQPLKNHGVSRSLTALGDVIAVDETPWTVGISLDLIDLTMKHVEFTMRNWDLARFTG